MQLHSRLICVSGLAVPAHAHVAGRYSLDTPFVVVEHFGCGKSGKDLDAEIFRLLAEPAADIAQAHHVIAVVLKAFGQQEIRNLQRRCFGQEQETVFAYRCVQRRVELLPVRKQLGESARVHHGAGQDMRAYFRALLDHAYAHFALFLDGKLLEADRRRQPGGTRADNDHVVLHRFALCQLAIPLGLVGVRARPDGEAREQLVSVQRPVCAQWSGSCGIIRAPRQTPTAQSGISILWQYDISDRLRSSRLRPTRGGESEQCNPAARAR
jgi:hypothetical protein